MKRRYRVLLTLAAVALVLAAVASVFYGVENWRGARAWEQARCELAARGESLNFGDFIPPPIPDDHNLAMARLFVEALDYRREPSTGNWVFGPSAPSPISPLTQMPAERNPAPTSTAPNGVSPWWKTGSALPLEPWQRLYAKLDIFPHPVQPGTAAQDILLALKKYDPALEEFAREAQTRPQSRFPVNWTQTPIVSVRLPQYALFQNLVSTLRLRALAELATGMHPDAARDTETMFWVCELTRHEPPLIAHLVNISCIGIALQPVWEGLANRRWTANELECIQKALRQPDLLTDFVEAMRCQRAFNCKMLDEFKMSRDLKDIYGPRLAGDPPEESPNLAAWASSIMPRGWVEQNKAMGCRDTQRWLLDAVDLKTRRVKPAIVDEGERNARQAKFGWYTFFFKSQVPLGASALLKAARMQTACDEAEVACALERYCLAHAAYPICLNALVPDYLNQVPTDLIDGQSLRYDKLRSGRYRIYGVGWDGVDDHGSSGWQRTTDAKNGTKGPWWPDDKGGDWSWRYTPIEKPDSAK